MPTTPRTSLKDYLLPRWWIILVAVLGWMVAPGPILAVLVHPAFILVPFVLVGLGGLYMLGGILVAAWRNPEDYE